MMKVFRLAAQTALLWGIYWVCNRFVQATGLPIPGNVIGVAVLFSLLCFGVVKLEHVQEAADFLLGLPFSYSQGSDYEDYTRRLLSAFYFQDDIKLKSNLADQICDATGGPCSYVGRDMKATHKGMKITEAEWSATVENLNKALDKHRVPAKEKQELIGAIGPMKGDIVGQ